MHTVSAWATRQWLALVTTNAEGTQTEIAQTIFDRGADYVLVLQENWPATYTEVNGVFGAPPPLLKVQRSATVDANHGRIETRRHSVCRDIGWLCFVRRHRGELAVPGLKAIGRLRNKPECRGVIARETRYCLTHHQLEEPA